MGPMRVAGECIPPLRNFRLKPGANANGKCPADRHFVGMPQPCVPSLRHLAGTLRLFGDALRKVGLELRDFGIGLRKVGKGLRIVRRQMMPGEVPLRRV